MTKKIFLLCFFLCWGAAGLLAQRLSVTGTVTDSITGEPLPYAAVVWEGTTVGAQTDADGRFSLSFSQAAGSHVLEISYMGYDTKRVPVRREAPQECFPMPIPVRPQSMVRPNAQAPYCCE